MKGIAHRQKLKVQARIGSQKFEMNRRKIDEEVRKKRRKQAQKGK